jgi:ABC-2 type transport system ATP-binding protein
MKKGLLVTAGAVDEVLVNEDIVQLGSSNLNQLNNAMQQFSGYTKIEQQNNFIELNFALGTAQLDKINEYCFQQGIVLNHLTIKRKSLEAKFFELTNN